MIRLWLQRKGYEPLRSDCRVERSDGADLPAIARGECRLWYERLLAEAQVSMLVPHDLADANGLAMSMTRVPSALLKLPEECVRPVAVKLTSWLAPARIVTPDDPLARLQSWHLSAGGVVNPVAVFHPDHTLELFSTSYEETEKIEYLLCVTRPPVDDEGNPTYEFQPAALATL